MSGEPYPYNNGFFVKVQYKRDRDGSASIIWLDQIKRICWNAILKWPDRNWSLRIKAASPVHTAL